MVATEKVGKIIKYKLIENNEIFYSFWLDKRSFKKGLINIEKEISIQKNDELYLNNLKEVKEFVSLLTYLK